MGLQRGHTASPKTLIFSVQLKLAHLSVSFSPPPQHKYSFQDVWGTARGVSGHTAPVRTFHQDSQGKPSITQDRTLDEAEPSKLSVLLPKHCFNRLKLKRKPKQGC